MISEAAGAGVIRPDVQQAIEREMRYRLGEGDAPGVLSRWQKELLLLVIHTVKANACLSQLHARAAVKAGATLAQVLQVIQYVELTGMVKWVMVGHDALTAAEAANGCLSQQRLVGSAHHLSAAGRTARLAGGGDYPLLYAEPAPCAGVRPAERSSLVWLGSWVGYAPANPAMPVIGCGVYVLIIIRFVPYGTTLHKGS
jgi:alkylhydroperoxidase/carboxymuconolactone decarboxylase family protein YurZ